MNAGNPNDLGYSLGWTDGSVSLSDPPLQNQKTMLFYCFPACLNASWRRQASDQTGAGERLMGVLLATESVSISQDQIKTATNHP